MICFEQVKGEMSGYYNMVMNQGRLCQEKPYTLPSQENGNPPLNQCLSISLSWNKELSTCLVSWWYTPSNTEQLSRDEPTAPPGVCKSNLHRTKINELNRVDSACRERQKLHLYKKRYNAIQNAICAHIIRLMHWHWTGWTASEGWIMPCRKQICNHNCHRKSYLV